MSAAFTNIVLDGLVIVFLVVTIAYCWRLNRRIQILQDGKSELAQLLKHFDTSTQRASESIIALQTASKKIGENIQFRIDKANYLLEDLSFMIEKGNKIADQLEASFAVNRARSRVLAEQTHEPAEAAPAVKPLPVMEQRPAERPVEREKPAVSSREKTSASLEAVLERVVGRSRSAAPEAEEAPPPARERPQPSRARSRAEQELLDMIKAGIKG